MEFPQLPNFTRKELLTFHARRISSEMQAKHLQQLKMLCLVASHRLNK
tara:strand:+ start:604 stop:747 length:144 start_codon:yes stop_codon:yes gene_type:complete